MEEFKYKVYVKLDENNCITGVESDLNLEDTTGYVQIDEGLGDKYAHAQGNYFDVNNGDKPLRDELGRCNYKYTDGKITLISDEDKLDFTIENAIIPTVEDRILSVETLLLDLI